MPGIYIHIPFCKQRCTYCDFHFSTNFSTYRSEMVEAIRKEIIDRKTEAELDTIETIYFGGGTPSLLNSEEIKSILKSIFENYKLSPNPEITLECNPDDMDKKKCETWFELGINRLSIGIQSFRPEDLKWMNRAHNSQESLNCIKIAQQAGFQNISIDLIYGLPNLSNQEWIENLNIACSMNVQHISAYCLTVEEKTKLAHLVQKNLLLPANEEEQSDQFEILKVHLKNHEIYQYETSNFSLLGFESKHNSAYWSRRKYLGFGPSAHSYSEDKRRWNIASNKQYIKLVNENEIFFEQEELNKKDVFNEAVMTGLRLNIGLNLIHLSDILPLSAEFHGQLEKLQTDKLATIVNNHLILSEKGSLQADAIASSLFQLDF